MRTARRGYVGGRFSEATRANGTRAPPPAVIAPEEVRRRAAASRGLGSNPLPGLRTHYGHAFVRTAALLAVPQPEHRRRGEDGTWVRAMLDRGHRAVYTSEALSLYREHTGITYMADLASQRSFSGTVGRPAIRK